MTKKCELCKAEKPLDQFHSNKSKKDGKSGRCKDCRKSERYSYAESARRIQLKNNFGITLEQYESMLSDQGGVCALCNGADSRALNVDHGHSCCPGKKSCGKCIRKLLCRKCNMAIGLLNDDINLLNKAIAYLAGG
jgi:hypothetical protein